MDRNKGKISLSLFGLAIVCFVLPFIDISCMGQTISFSGIDMAKGISYADYNQPANSLLIAAIVIAVCGGLLFFWKNRSSQIVQTILGIAGGILLIAVKVVGEKEINEAGVPFQVEWRYGYYLALISLFGAAVYNIYQLYKGKSSTPVAFSSGSADSKCPHCHRGNEAGSAWCRWCGGSMTAGSTNGPICPHCQKANELNSAWCQWCGGKVGEQVQPAANMCPHCGKGNEPESKFCYWCGESMSVSAADRSTTPPSYDKGNTDVGFSPTVPLTASVIAEVDTGPIPFLRVQRVGRWELIPILKNEFIVGADPVCSDYIEHSGNLGQSHAMVVKENDTFSISKSNEGVVQVNNQPVNSAQKYPLNPGDVVSMGNIEYIFDLA